MKTLIRLPAFKGNPFRKLRNNNFSKVIKVITWIFSISSPQHYFAMKDRIEYLIKVSGPTFVVQYLKESTRIVQKFVAGQPCSQSEGVLVSLIKGLPKWIPGPLRIKIRNNDPVTIRAVLSVLTLYKILDCKPKLKINSITDPFTGFSRTINPLKLAAVAEWFPKGTFSKSHTIISVNAGPNHKKAFLSLPADAYALARKPRVLLGLGVLAQYFDKSNIYQTLKEEITMVNTLFLDSSKNKAFILGKLSFLLESAGKVRVVAILDGWTQMILSGLHDTVSTILKEIPQDGTFDQGKPIDLLSKQESIVYSFDLSSATDRLPIDLQRQVISLFSTLIKDCKISNKEWSNISEAWVTVLTERAYKCLDPKFNLDTFVKYAVGQPMGCLSSFNMLALTHHFIVQVAAFNCGHKQ